MFSKTIELFRLIIRIFVNTFTSFKAKRADYEVFNVSLVRDHDPNLSWSSLLVILTNFIYSYIRSIHSSYLFRCSFEKINKKLHAHLEEGTEWQQRNLQMATLSIAKSNISHTFDCSGRIAVKNCFVLSSWEVLYSCRILSYGVPVPTVETWKAWYYSIRNCVFRNKDSSERCYGYDWIWNAFQFLFLRGIACKGTVFVCVSRKMSEEAFTWRGLLGIVRRS